MTKAMTSCIVSFYQQLSLFQVFILSNAYMLIFLLVGGGGANISQPPTIDVKRYLFQKRIQNPVKHLTEAALKRCS